MPKRAILLLTGCLTMGGCAPQIQESGVDFSQSKPLMNMAISSSANLKGTKVWPLKGHGTYLQKVKTTVKDQEHVLSVHITLSPEKLEFIAFNDIAGRLYHLVWTPESIAWQASDHLPSTLLPENIIADFLLVHLTKDELTNTLQGATFEEENNGRIIQDAQGIIRKITRSNLVGSLWQNVTIENPTIGYTLEIQTIPVP